MRQVSRNSSHSVCQSANCKLKAIDRRLSDLHLQWHDAEDAYFDPNAFRIAIQTCIQTARTVTFILQSNKALFPDFDAWYVQWQDQFRSIPLMKWMVDARNKIEKRGDLETHSDVTVSILASYLDHERVSVQVETDLFDSTQQLMEKIPKYALRKHVLRDGILQIQRRWVANDLPEYELLDAVAEAYGHLSRLVHDAHLALGLLAPDITSNVHGLTYDHEAMDGKLPCMIGHERRRSCDIWLATGERMEIETKLVTVSRAEAEKVSGRYDIDFSEVYSGANTPEETLRKLFDVARKMFLNDEYHATIAILLKGIIPVDIQELRPEEHGQKYVMAQMLADQVRRVGADTVIVIGEIWTAPFDPEQPLARAVDSSDKSEALSGTLVQKRGEPLRISAEILRGVDRVALKASTEQSGGAHNFFSPIYDVWGRAKSPSAEEAQHDK